MKTLQELPKIHLCCGADELRPIFNYVLVTKEDIVASNAHILVIHKTLSIFDQDSIDLMPERFLIHRKVWSLMCKPFVSIAFFNGSITIKFSEYKLSFPIIMEAQFDTGYPDYNSVLPKIEDKKEIGKIGFNIPLLDNLVKAMFRPDEPKQIKFDFYDSYRAVMVYPINIDLQVTGLIMPMSIPDEINNY